MSLPETLRRAISVLEGSGKIYGDLVQDLQGELDVLERRQTVKREQKERRPAVEGEKFVWREGGSDGEEIEMVVRAKSPEPPRRRKSGSGDPGGSDGRWMCISCGVGLAHNLEKDTHCSGGSRRGKRRLLVELGDRTRHVLAWRNFASGFVEVP